MSLRIKNYNLLVEFCLAYVLREMLVRPLYLPIRSTSFTLLFFQITEQKSLFSFPPVQLQSIYCFLPVTSSFDALTFYLSFQLHCLVFLLERQSLTLYISLSGMINLLYYVFLSPLLIFIPSFYFPNNIS